IAREDHTHFTRVLLQDVGSGAHQALLQITVLFEDLAGEDHGDRFGHVLREQHVGRDRCTRSVYLSGVSIPSISRNGKDCSPSFAYCSKQYFTSAAVSSRPFSGGMLCHLTPRRRLKGHGR